MVDDNHYMTLALQQAELAAAMGEVPVGALLVLADGRQFAAHNEPITRHDPAAHAEMRAIQAACKACENYRLSGATLFVTLEPCTMCAGAIVHARISRVVYGTSDPKTGAVDSLYRILSDTRLNHQPEVTSGIMADACSTLLKDFFRQRRKQR
ncbi:tRNA adenosine(34) deaminase TadA [Mariprofundus erugo]|uniref:tRNA-specific adenosine deaminase n=1 Tax=Mariprofundus erugo TaxID=2528639 RepID=A0A5R9GPU7_9PROT|nr:tRNA adenosine(34) deaminase TadA [Mariprofundus erugo]TLS66002.1 tRNA adenosine(34) deaminase TadA [Mariprofundus erugo]